jgi:chorismate mutase
MVTLNEEIKNLRIDLDKLDQEILSKLYQRIGITEKIGKIKKSGQSDILDKKREAEVLSNLIASGKKFGIDDKFIISLWRQIMDYSYKVQEECK